MTSRTLIGTDVARSPRFKFVVENVIYSGCVFLVSFFSLLVFKLSFGSDLAYSDCSLPLGIALLIFLDRSLVRVFRKRPITAGDLTNLKLLALEIDCDSKSFPEIELRIFVPSTSFFGNRSKQEVLLRQHSEFCQISVVGRVPDPVYLWLDKIKDLN
jgi:hypothetical protein